MATQQETVRVRTGAAKTAAGTQVARSKRAKDSARSERSPAELASQYTKVALALQGGGALGAYQCGVYEALHDAGIRPHWFVGTSIGAINAAILAGNAPEHRVERLHEFWDMICQPAGGADLIAAGVRDLLAWYPNNDQLAHWAQSLGALGALLFGQQGFFTPRRSSPFLFNDGSAQATSFYDTTALRGTLEHFVDFDRINAADGPRLSVGAVDVETGNSHYFDSNQEILGPEHIMASGALPPGFPAIEINGRHYWDGGVVSNTPLDRVWHETPRCDTLVLQVDLWSAQGRRPQNMIDVLERQKDILYSSRTRAITDHGVELQKLRLTIKQLLEQVPEDTVDPRLLAKLQPWACSHVFNIVHLIYQAKSGEAQYKDYAFGIGTQREHWADGLADMQQTLEYPEFFLKPRPDQGVVTHDVHELVAPRRPSRQRAA
ncbi:MAG: patatin-like phospholipase family protein [Ottowia sp.]|nr:patatin-like phospholipase family protein [Ottowia sp.]